MQEMVKSSGTKNAIKNVATMGNIEKTVAFAFFTLGLPLEIAEWAIATVHPAYEKQATALRDKGDADDNKLIAILSVMVANEIAFE